MIQRWSMMQLVLMLCSLLIGMTTIFGQATSTMSGRVTDPQGNVLAGATVTVTNSATGLTRTVTTNNDGGYTVPQIPPGTYKVQAQAQGFATVVQEDVTLLVNTPLTLNIQFKQLGAVTETVTVQGGETTINTTDASIGNNFVAQQIAELPLNARNVVSLLSLQPGVTPNGYVTGSRADQANVTLDGIDVNEQQTGLDPLSGAAFASVLRVTPDSVQEFRVMTTNPTANLGRSSGGQVSLVTKGGTNDFHGLLYEYHRNTVTSANDFFNNRSGIDRPKLIRNLFGGSLGGPIVKDKIFFFYTYEGRRDASEATVSRDVPLPILGRGELQFRERLPDGTISTRVLNTTQLNALFPAGINPAAVAALADAAQKYPANDPGRGDGVHYSGFRFNAPTPLRWNTNIAKLDFNLNDKHSLSLRGNYQYDVIGRVPQFPDTPTPNVWYHPVGLSAGHTWVMSNNLVNNFRYGLTRLSLSNQGDSGENAVSFRFIFSPRTFSRTLNRITPVHNFVDDLSWNKGNHNFQLGTNIRVVRNDRTSFGNSFDNAIANPSFYDLSGAVLSNPITANFNVVGSLSTIRNAMSALIGRFSQYTANFNFDADGNILPVGEGVGRKFATEEYEGYAQDNWKLRPNLTLTYGLRYSLSRPVYEANGLQVKPTVSLGDYFDKRKGGAITGQPFNDLITVDLAGPANGRPGFYDWDKNNFQPRLAVAWSPNFENGFLKRLFGGNGKSVLRGGFAMTNDQFGQQLAVSFDSLNTLGFSSSQTIAANTFNVTNRLAPLFTGFDINVRSLPGINTPGSLVFPLTTPADEAQRIEASLDDTLVTPTSYSWNTSFSREFRGGFTVEASYIGRLGRNLLATRDIMALNNLVDPKSGVDWYTAASQVADLRLKNTPLNSVPAIPYFENLFPNLGANFWGDPTISSTQAVYGIVAREDFFGFDFFNVLDWTFVQLLLDDLGVSPNMFFHPQYAALSTFSTIAHSNYNAGTLTVKQRFREQLFLDFNYTFSKSFDNASGLQTSGAYGSAFILNPLRPEDNYAVSDFDIRHIINANAVWQLPFGRGKRFLSGVNGFGEAVLGGWQFSGIFRWNSGTLAGDPFDAAQWATNWNVQSNAVRTRPLKATVNKRTANIFSDPTFAYQSYRNALPGETGERNVLRVPSFVSLDIGLAKHFTMPWKETHKLQFRWEAFNLTNTQRFGVLQGGRDGLGVDIDPQLGTPAPAFGNFTAIQGTPRVMQFALRYQF